MWRNIAAFLLWLLAIATGLLALVLFFISRSVTDLERLGFGLGAFLTAAVTLGIVAGARHLRRHAPPRSARYKQIRAVAIMGSLVIASLFALYAGILFMRTEVLREQILTAFLLFQFVFVPLALLLFGIASVLRPKPRFSMQRADEKWQNRRPLVLQAPLGVKFLYWSLLSFSALGLALGVHDQRPVWETALAAGGWAMMTFGAIWIVTAPQVRLWPDRLQWRRISFRRVTVAYTDIKRVEQAALLAWGASKIWRFHLHDGRIVPVGGINLLNHEKRRLILSVIREANPSVKMWRENWMGEMNKQWQGDVSEG